MQRGFRGCGESEDKILSIRIYVADILNVSFKIS